MDDATPSIPSTQGCYRYPSDFFSDPVVMFWDMERYGCYCKLIDYLWLTGGSIRVFPEKFQQNSSKIPANFQQNTTEIDRKLCEVFRVSHRKKAGYLLGQIIEKFDLMDGILTHRRVTKELQKQREFRAMAKDRAEKAAKARWGDARSNRTNTNTNTKGDTPIVPKPEPVRSKKSKPDFDIERAFLDFWKLYPNKKGKKKAEILYKKIIAEDPGLVERINEAVRDQAATDEWIKYDGTYIPHPTTWLNGDRWEDTLPHKKSAIAGMFGPHNPKVTTRDEAEQDAKVIYGRLYENQNR